MDRKLVWISTRHKLDFKKKTLWYRSRSFNAKINQHNWILFHDLLEFASSPPWSSEYNTNLEDNDTSKSHYPWFDITCCVEGPPWLGLELAFCLELGCMSLFYIRRSWPHKVQFQFFTALGNNAKQPWDRDMLIFIVNLTLVFTKKINHRSDC